MAVNPNGGIAKVVIAAMALVWASCFEVKPLMAQTASGENANAPDKTSYTFFNPAPDDQLRDLCTDRPPKANLPCTVDAGHFQYESDVFNWTHAYNGGTTTDTFLYTNPTLKVGVTNTIDLEASMAPFARMTTKNASGSQSVEGVGDMYYRAKLNLAGPEGGDFQMAVIPYVKAPTGSHGISNKAVEGGAIVPVSFALPQGFTLLFDPEIDVLRNANDFGRHTNVQFLGNLSHALADGVTGYIELWGQANNDPASPNKQASLDLSLAWLAWKKSPSLQFDVGANIGLTAATPRLQLYLGVSQKF
ncbi:MAG TPA: transporter [Methylocystis sp.]|nr:transporter [Methylocystis sp.]